MATITINVEPIYALLEAALNQAGKDWYDLARKRAPVSGANKLGRADEPGARSADYPVRPSSVTGRGARSARSRGSVSKTTHFLRGLFEKGDSDNRTVEGGHIGRSRGRQFPQGQLQTFRYFAQRHGSRGNAKIASLYTIIKGPHKGQSPDFLLERGGRLRGVKANEGGTLRDSIELVPAVREGDSIKVTLKATAPYAYYMEYGFNHKGGARVAGRHFMRGPLKDIIVPNLKSGQYFKKG